MNWAELIGQKPAPTPEPLVFTGEPVWAYVDINKNGYERAKLREKRHIVDSDGIGFRAICHGLANTKATSTSYCPFAWRIPEGEE